MSQLGTLTIVLLLVIAVPLFIVLHFITKWKQTREISKDDEQLLEDMWQLSLRMEERLETLEKILDDDLPTWRRKE